MVRPRVRQQILDAAAELLESEGLAALTTRNVARAAGVTQASVFNNFGDKAGLLHALLIDLPGHQRMYEHLETLNSCDPAYWLAQVFVSLCEYFEQLLPLSLPVLEAGGSDEANTLLELMRGQLKAALDRQRCECPGWPLEVSEEQVESLLSQALLAAYSQLLCGREDEGYQAVASQWLSRRSDFLPGV